MQVLLHRSAMSKAHRQCLRGGQKSSWVLRFFSSRGRLKNFGTLLPGVLAPPPDGRRTFSKIDGAARSFGRGRSIWGRRSRLVPSYPCRSSGGCGYENQPCSPSSPAHDGCCPGGMIPRPFPRPSRPLGALASLAREEAGSRFSQPFDLARQRQPTTPALRPETRSQGVLLWQPTAADCRRSCRTARRQRCCANPFRSKRRRSDPGCAVWSRSGQSCAHRTGLRCPS